MAAKRGVITAAGRRKLCRALAGDSPLPPLARVAWGNGGTDENGQPLATTGNEIGLYNELLSRDIESHAYPDEGETTCKYRTVLGEGDLSGEMISEIGLFDTEGDLVVYRTFLPKGKDEDAPQAYSVYTIF